MQGVYLTVARVECISGPNVAIHHNKFIHIFACLYSEYCVTHISTQLAYCANIMAMLSCIAIMKLLHQPIDVETLYLICATYALSKTTASPVCTTFHRFNDLKFDSVSHC